ncbi:MAG: twin-arginine translocase TatA/TatE family subunit [Anaerolineales bacterium]|nr:twin-arginine translocase TatA/TatE family subunit [Anaerolineales bacterium]
MDLLGIGLPELLLIVIIILLVASPKDIAKTARGLGRGLNRLYRSPNYQVIRKASEEVRNLPARLAREAHLEELNELKEAERELREAANSIGESVKPFQAWVEDLGPANATTPKPVGPPSAPAAAQPAASASPAEGKAPPVAELPPDNAPAAEEDAPAA